MKNIFELVLLSYIYIYKISCTIITLKNMRKLKGKTSTRNLRPEENLFIQSEREFYFFLVVREPLRQMPFSQIFVHNYIIDLDLLELNTLIIA